jgi:hypothetical protein
MKKGDEHHPYIIQQTDDPNEHKMPPAQNLRIYEIPAYVAECTEVKPHAPNCQNASDPDYDSQITSPLYREGVDHCNDDVSACLSQMS